MKTILIANNENNWATDLTNSISPLNWPVKTVSTIPDALKWIKYDTDIVLFDIWNYNDDLCKAVYKINKHGSKKMKILVLYAPSNDSGILAIDLIKNGAQWFVPNNLETIELSNRISTNVEMLLSKKKVKRFYSNVNYFPTHCLIDFKIKCNISKINKQAAFIATPFSSSLEYTLDYSYGILPALKYFGIQDTLPMWESGYETITKKVCCSIHRAILGIANISPEYKQKGLLQKRKWRKTNLNVALEVGIMKERGMPTILICRKLAWMEAKTFIPTDIDGLEILIYEDRIQLTCELIKRLNEFGFKSVY